MAANQAEVDLIVNAAGALPDLERQLSRIVRTAEDQAPEVDVQASLAVQNSIAVMSTQLDQVLRQVDASDPSVDVEAALDAQASLRSLRQDLDELTRRAASGATDIIELEAALDFPSSLAEVTAAINDLVTDVEAIAPDIELEVDVDTDDVPRAERVLRSLGRTSITTAKGLGTVGAGVSKLSLAIGGGANAAAGLVAALEQVGPAAAVATQAMLAQKLTAGTLKLAMIGVEDAIKGAFDPELSPDEFHKSLKGLAPEARLFVDQIHTMRRELRALQKGVQNRVFKDFDEVLAGLGRQVLPDIRIALSGTATALNRMGKETAIAALRLSKSGALGEALDGATAGLTNLEKVPGRLATSFTLLAAGAAPAFDRITSAIDRVTASVAERLQQSFTSGELQRAIDGAIDTLVQLGTVVGNFGAGIGNIFSGLTQNGGGLFDILEKVSEAFERLTASREFQTILAELSLTAGVLVDNILPLVQEAFIQLAPVIEELAPVVRDFVAAIGPELIPIIQELGPILIDIALILREQLPLAIELANAAIDALGVALVIVGGAMDIAREASEFFSDFMESDFARAMGAASDYALTNSAEIKGAFVDWTSAALGSVLSFQSSLAGFSANVRDMLVGGFRRLFSDILGNIQTFVSLAAESFAGLPGRLYQVGLDIMAGLASGLTAGIGRVIGIAQGIADSVVGTIKGALDIRSPSHVMRKIGRDTVEGFRLGMVDKLPGVAGVGLSIAKIATSAGVTAPTIAMGNINNLGGPQIARIPTAYLEPQRILNIYLGGKLIEQIIDDRIKATINRNTRVQAQGVRI